MEENEGIYKKLSPNYDTTYITVFGTLFLCWLAQEILERAFGMAPAIRRAQSLHEQAAKKSNNPIKANYAITRLTKALDKEGRFRIQTRGTIYYIKGIWNIVMWCTFIYVCVSNKHWLYDHLYRQVPDTTFYLPYQHVAASILAFYAWEMCANRYARLNYSIIVHHWLTSLAALLILMGAFNPFATWYGMTAVQSVFPIWFVLGFRATYANKYPEFTRKGFIFSYYWYFCIICLNMMGQCLLIIRSFWTKTIPYYTIILIIIAIIGWMIDDIDLLKSLKDMATHDYEDADLVNHKKTIRDMGGRSIFAISILSDADDNTNKTASPPFTSSSNNKNNGHLSTSYEASISNHNNNNNNNVNNAPNKLRPDTIRAIDEIEQQQSAHIELVKKNNHYQ
jgi:hypothetical protein